MAELGESIILPKPEGQKETDLFNTLRDFMRNVARILNRGIVFADNVDCVLVSFTSSATPDASNTVAHLIGRIPIGYIVYSQDKAGSLYLGGTTWTATNIYLKSDVASVAFKIIIF